VLGFPCLDAKSIALVKNSGSFIVVSGIYLASSLSPFLSIFDFTSTKNLSPTENGMLGPLGSPVARPSLIPKISIPFVSRMLNVILFPSVPKTIV
jgi:hypothetical protein